MRLKIISFDVEGTLITHRFSEIVWEEAIPKLYSEKEGISIDEAISCVMEEYNKIGEERMEWYDIKYWFDYFGLNDYEKLLNRHKNEISCYPEVQQTLQELSENYRLIVNSNSPREFLELETEKFKRFFHHIFSAPSDFRQVKTIDFYRTICDVLKIKPEEMAHVGDHWVYDFVAPREIGIHAFYLDRKLEKQNEHIINNLKELKIVLEKLEIQRAKG